MKRTYTRDIENFDEREAIAAYNASFRREPRDHYFVNTPAGAKRCAHCQCKPVNAPAKCAQPW